MNRYIDADKAIEIITEVIHDTVIEDADVVASEVETVLYSMPTADVREVNHCHIVHDKGGWLSCSNCHILLPQLFDVYRFFFCPNCGAIMDEVTE